VSGIIIEDKYCPVFHIFGRFFASLAGINEAAYYEIPQAEKETPKVKFN
jgi:hypothetical protein